MYKTYIAILTFLTFLFSSIDYEEIVKFFGYRGKKVQSLCRKCRTEHSARRR